MASFGAAEEEADREAIARVVEASNATESPFAFYNLGCTKYYAQDFDGKRELASIRNEQGRANKEAIERADFQFPVRTLLRFLCYLCA